MNKINIHQKLDMFTDYWNPRIIGELNGQQVKLVKLNGEFIWHMHENEDELFYVLKGKLIMEFRDRKVEVNENEIIIIPHGTEHRSVAKDEVSVMVFEPSTTLKTGNVKSSDTDNKLERI